MFRLKSLTPPGIWAGRRPTRIILLAALVGLAVGFGVYVAMLSAVGIPDFWQPWFGARSILHGIDPYPIVGPGRQVSHTFRFLYPLTASVIVLPLGLLSIALATAIFSGLSAALLAYALPLECWAVFLSIPFLTAAYTGQWSPLLTACFLLPTLSWLSAGKPSIGAAVFVARPNYYGLVGGLAVFGASLAFVPHWPAEWLASVRTARHMTPVILRPGGFVGLLALIRWRRPEARLVAMLSLVPQTNVWYEALPLFAVPQTFRESLFLAIATSLPLSYEVFFGSNGGVVNLSPEDYQLALFAYLPCVVMILLRRNTTPQIGGMIMSGSRSED